MKTEDGKTSGYTDAKFPEFAACRDEDGVCSVCECKLGDPHVIRRHDNYDAAMDATW